MKYKDFNKILEAYQVMADESIRVGNLKAAEMCSIIIEDLQHLFKLGYSNSPDTSKKKKETK